MKAVMFDHLDMERNTNIVVPCNLLNFDEAVNLQTNQSDRIHKFESIP